MASAKEVGVLRWLRRRPPPWRPTAWRTRFTSAGWLRVETMLDGHRIFVETRDGTLNPSSEAMACWFLPACLRTGMRAVIPGGIDREWRRNARRITRIFAKWWGWHRSFPLRFAGRTWPPPAETSRVAAFFTGGVDSIHTLLFPEAPIHALIHVAGFDTLLKDEERLDWIERDLRETAARHGMEAVFLRTNLRNWKAFNDCDWACAHGAALAGVGHLLAHRFGRILIPSSAPDYRVQESGSNPLTDPLWSSSRLRFVHDGGPFDRIQKIGRIAASQECHEWLRVCWQNVPGALNCGRCEKCLRTRLAFHSLGLPAPATLPDDSSLAADFEALEEPLPVFCLVVYNALLERIPPHAPLAEVIRRKINAT